MLQKLKDFAIANGMERWARPVWERLTGKGPDLYDEQTGALIRKYLRADSVCIDVGCHKGAILDRMIEQCPQGKFYAFEPIPSLSALLRRKYRNNRQVFINELALSNEDGTVDFNIDVEVPGRSGLRDTSDDREQHKTILHTVRTARLDTLVSLDRIDFVKIDVEGAELGVLQGASELFRRHTPLTVFEHSKYSACHYNTRPADIFDFFASCGMEVSSFDRVFTGEDGFSVEEFTKDHEVDDGYVFVAYHPNVRATRRSQ